MPILISTPISAIFGVSKVCPVTSCSEGLDFIFPIIQKFHPSNIGIKSYGFFFVNEKLNLKLAY